MSRPQRIIGATIIALLITVVAIELPGLKALLYPGLVISQLLGADSVHDPGRGRLAAILLLLGSILFWGVVAYGTFSIRWSRRAR
jgi:hypothetical protein